jgi:hypothetical protein
MAKKNADAGSEGADVGHAATKAPILITSGYKQRGPRDGYKVANFVEVLEKAGSVEDIQSLVQKWSSTLAKIGESHYVPSIPNEDEPVGVFSQKFAESIKQITPLKNVYCVTFSLGLVRLNGRYPLVNFGAPDSSQGIYTIGADGNEEAAPSPKEWWDALTSNETYPVESFASVIGAACKAGKRVIVALNGLSLLNQTNDLNKALAALGQDVMYKHVRFVGPGLEDKVPAKLLPCCMPFDAERLNAVVPGPKAQGVKRMAYLLTHILGDAPTDPVHDSNACENALNTEWEEPFIYETSGGSRSARKKVDDAELKAIIERLTKVAGHNPQRIMRMAKSEGVSVSESRIAELMGTEPTTKASKAKTAKEDAVKEKALKVKAQAKVQSKPKGKTAKKSKK